MPRIGQRFTNRAAPRRTRRPAGQRQGGTSRAAGPTRRAPANPRPAARAPAAKPAGQARAAQAPAAGQGPAAKPTAPKAAAQTRAANPAAPAGAQAAGAKPATQARSAPAAPAAPAAAQTAAAKPATPNPNAPAAKQEAAPKQDAPAKGGGFFGGLFGAAKPAAPAGGAPAGGAPAAGADKPAEGGGFGGFLQGLQQKAKDVVGQFQPELTPERRKAAEHVRDMLEPNKLGGADRTFNYGDVDAITRALMCDTCGLKNEVQGQLRGQGKNFQANLVGKALNGGRGLLKNAARKKVYNEAPGQIAGQLRQGLAEAKTDPNTARAPDRTPRNLTFNELRSFERNARVLQQMQQEATQKLGMDIQFPGGMSQASIQHMLDGGIGFPPGSVVKPLK